MATQKYSSHAVGNLNSKEDVLTIPEVKAGADLDNYTLVELTHDGSGVRVATQLSDITKKSYLACAVEVLYDNEFLKEFYIGTGEFFRAIHLKAGVRFESSAYTGTPVVGQFAHFDPATKKFVVDAVKNATAVNNFLIVDIVALDYSIGVPALRLEVL